MFLVREYLLCSITFKQVSACPCQSLLPRNDLEQAE
jgi:hypothetical protein